MAELFEESTTPPCPACQALSRDQDSEWVTSALLVTDAPSATELVAGPQSALVPELPRRGVQIMIRTEAQAAMDGTHWVAPAHTAANRRAMAQLACHDRDHWHRRNCTPRGMRSGLARPAPRAPDRARRGQTHNGSVACRLSSCANGSRSAEVV